MIMSTVYECGREWPSSPLTFTAWEEGWDIRGVTVNGQGKGGVGSTVLPSIF
jgi:hypothetical protein